jgi:hypothetical protein
MQAMQAMQEMQAMQAMQGSASHNVNEGITASSNELKVIPGNSDDLK